MRVSTAYFGSVRPAIDQHETRIAPPPVAHNERTAHLELPGDFAWRPGLQPVVTLYAFGADQPQHLRGRGARDIFPIAAFENGRADGQRIAEIIGGSGRQFDQT